MFPVAFLDGGQYADHFAEHATIGPKSAAVSDRAPDRAASGDAVHTTKDGFAHWLLGSKAIGGDVHDGRRINGFHDLAGGRDFELADVCGEKPLRREIAGFDLVKVDKLQPPYADRGQLQRNLPANGAHA